MSLTNAPDLAIRQAVVQQDLDNVLHPIVQYKALEAKQVVVTGAEGSTIYDADGTAYLDAMAGLWCVNIGYGRAAWCSKAAHTFVRQITADAIAPRHAMPKMSIPRPVTLASDVSGVRDSRPHRLQDYP